MTSKNVIVPLNSTSAMGYAGGAAFRKDQPMPDVWDAMLSAAPQLSEAEMVEIVADLEHQQWMHWSQAVAHTVSSYQLKTWQHLWVPYEQLPEDEKEKDRVWARKTLRALNLI
jgi:hypothetical protein